jgi:DMSO/TMAO reductase YedYZ molybdopterin-dependent catalytic subunit
MAGASGLAAGELFAGLDHDFTSPVISVGNKAIDLVPVPLKNFAIETFGKNDKTALLAGIYTAIAIFALVVGLAARSRRWLGVAGLVLFAVVGATAAVGGRTGTIGDAGPSVVAAIVATGVLLFLLPRRRPLAVLNNVSPRAANDVVMDPSRRRFLATAAVIGAAAATTAVVGRRLQSATSAVADRTRRIIRSTKPLPAAPSTIQAVALATATPFFTPNRDFYRIDTALIVPRIDASKWKLTVKGMVDRERTYTYDDLLSRELVERDITLTCVSNEVGGQLMGTARWVGVPLRELLDEAGADPKATQVVGRSIDGWTSGFPTAVVRDGRDAIVALSMNGESLPFAHGYPARLVVPGLYGYVSATKWLSSIELSTLDAFDAYWVPRGYSKLAPIKLASRIDVPRGLATVKAGATPIAGIAWAQRHGISSVEISIDGGAWIPVELAAEQSIDTWRQWHTVWDATPGRHEIAVRAKDRDGKLQTEERTAPLPNGATGWHSIVVLVSA